MGARNARSRARDPAIVARAARDLAPAADRAGGALPRLARAGEQRIADLHHHRGHRLVRLALAGIGDAIHQALARHIAKDVLAAVLRDAREIAERPAAEI